MASSALIHLPAPSIEGFFLGLSLIIAIGAQNLFVLRQGIIGRYLMTVACISAICDFVMIALGTLGAGSFIADQPLLRQFAVLLGVVFLCYCGLQALKNIRDGRSVQALQATSGGLSYRQVIFHAMGFSLLNPHAILDTVILMGSISAQYGSFGERVNFATGAGVASVVWFFTLAYGARLLAPLFKKPSFAKGLDVFVAIVMFAIAGSLIYGELTQVTT